MLQRNYVTDDGTHIVVTITDPEPAEVDWQVRLQSKGLADDFDRPIYGIDGMQAVELALNLLKTIEHVEGLKLPKG